MPDLVGGVAVRRDAIGADDDEIDAPVAHQRRGHAFRDDGRLDAVLHQLPRGQAGALQKRAGLVGEDRHLLALVRSAPRITPSAVP